MVNCFNNQRIVIPMLVIKYFWANVGYFLHIETSSCWLLPQYFMLTHKIFLNYILVYNISGFFVCPYAFFKLVCWGNACKYLNSLFKLFKYLYKPCNCLFFKLNHYSLLENHKFKQHYESIFSLWWLILEITRHYRISFTDTVRTIFRSTLVCVSYTTVNRDSTPRLDDASSH